jgi:peptidyl-prolyl cis-trans isomerase B (cyclophilin B)
VTLRSLFLLLSLLAVVVAGCGSDDDDNSSGDSTKRVVKGGCEVVDAPEPKEAGAETKPTAKLASGTTYDVVLKTSCGSFTIRLDQKLAPNTTASFASLVRKGYFDDTTFHRVVPGFVIQGGDPLGTGQGTPGYSTRDVPPDDTQYVRGVVAMGKTGEEPPGTAGSQFFVVTGPDAGLPPDYTVIGKVTKGMNVVDRISRLGDPAAGERGTPKRTILVEKAQLDEQ